MAKQEKIAVCPQHDYRVPLIATLVFAGAEWWCPYCGHQTGIIGFFDECKRTPTLILRHYAYKQYSKDYLSAVADLSVNRLHLEYPFENKIESVIECGEFKNKENED